MLTWLSSVHGLTASLQKYAMVTGACRGSHTSNVDVAVAQLSSIAKYSEQCAKSNVLLGGHGDLLSKHRIGSATSANADQSGGLMLHDFLARCILEAFRAWGDGDLDDDEGDQDYRKMVAEVGNKSPQIPASSINVVRSFPLHLGPFVHFPR